MYIIVTNNKKCLYKYQSDLKIDFLDGKAYMDVLVKVRDYIHLGYRLETHPMAGSLKPNQIPYKSIIISDLKVDKDELLEYAVLIENSIESCQKFMKDRSTPDWEKSILEDFEDVDLSLIDGGVNKLI